MARQKSRTFDPEKSWQVYYIRRLIDFKHKWKKKQKTNKQKTKHKTKTLYRRGAYIPLFAELYGMLVLDGPAAKGKLAGNLGTISTALSSLVALYWKVSTV